MSLPETRREQYLAVMAGQGTAADLPERPLTREEVYLDEIARNGGGGGGGDVTGVKGNAETDYRTGNVNITAENVGAYTKQQINTLLDAKADTTDLASKTDKVTTATENNLAAFDDSGNLKDSGKSASDFVEVVSGKGLSTNDYTDEEKTKLAGLENYDDTTIQGDISDIQAVIPSTASTSNKLSTASDTAGKEIAGTATGTSITLSDSADGYVQGVTVKGHSEKSKNLLEITATTQTVSDVTFTIDKSAGTIKANGTASASFILPIYTLSVAQDTNMHISGAISPVILQVYNSTTGEVTAVDIGNGKTFLATTGVSYIIRIYMGTGNNANNIIFKPMLCTAADYAADPTFEPYFEGIKSIGDAGWGVVDLGTLTWGEFQAGTQRWFSNALANLLSYGTRLTPLYCQIYNTIDDGSAYDLSRDKVIYTSANPDAYIFVQDHAFTDATAFKSAMSGVLLYYPLADTTGATPTLGITSKDGAGQGTAATITTGLPLRSVSDTIFDTADNVKVTKKCAEVDLGTLTWEYTSNRFQAQLSGSSVTSGGVDAICDNYTLYKGSLAGFSEADKSINVGNLQLTNIPYVLVRDTSYTDAATFATAMSGVKLVYPLATPIETPLTSAEKSALASLRTYSPNTQIDATDSPNMTADYLLNTDNGQAVARVDERSVSQISNLLSLIAAPYDETATYAQGDYCTYLGTLYKATAAIGTAEPFNPSHWTATTIMTEI